jgi:UDP-GlcNAc:undecaprenyl-phosphate/decaprenyl-phosphate GlcNAc-1-phosphate transferase
MSPDLRALAVFAAGGFAAWLFTPLATALANRLRFFDIPVGYKGHTRVTPYLGGTAILAAILVAVGALASSAGGQWPLLGFAAVLWALGTLDDRVNVPVAVRLSFEIGIGVAIWALGDGWVITGYDGFNLVVTVLWIVGLVNAFNLMDNMDGAAATAAGVSAAGTGALALAFGNPDLAPVCFAVAGACAGFLPYNLARPARIFMGDGGSLPIGLLVAALTILTVRSSQNSLGATGVIVGGLIVGLVILDTSLVTFSRARGRRPLFSGGRDHLTHRVVGQVGSSRAVAAAIAFTQVVACGVAIGVSRAGIGWVILAGGTAMALGTVLIWQLERLPLFKATSPPDPVAPSARLALIIPRRRSAKSQADKTATERSLA